MTKKFLVSIIIFSLLGFIGCSNNFKTSELVNNEGYEEKSSEMDIKSKIKKFEDEIGLEYLSELSGEDIFKLSNRPNDEFVKMRKSKINEDLLIKEVIYQTIDRAKYLANDIYNAAKDNGTTRDAFTYMSTINSSDALGNFISKDVALELLNTLLEFGNSDFITILIQNHDDKMYEFNYLCSLLQRYFIVTNDFSIEEKKLISPYLADMSEFSLYYISDPSLLTFDILKEDMLTHYDNALLFLNNYR